MKFINTANIIFTIRLVVALFFILSGLIKLNDPLGFSYKLEEYFEVFHISFLKSYSVVLALFLCCLEFVFGGYLLFKFYYRNVLIGLLMLILFFTFLTFYSAYFDVVKSCGCFGDAIPLKPWESFIKDLILLILILILLKFSSNVNSKFPKTPLTSLLIILLPLFLGLYTYFTKPILDFLPYKVGAHLPSLMKLDANAVKSEYQIIYKLENQLSKNIKTLTDKEYLSSKIYLDTNWKLIHSSEPKLIKKGDAPVISDLSIYDKNGIDHTFELIEKKDFHFLIIAYDLKSTKIEKLIEIDNLTKNLNKNINVTSTLITASSSINAKMLADKHHLKMDILFADAVPLKSIIRSNPGLVLMKNGRIINKWPSLLIPKLSELEHLYFNKK